MDMATDVRPQTDAIEELLAAVWSEVLDGTPVGPADNFFDLGGDSLLILETIALAREEGLDYTPLDLIENQTVAELAARVTAATAPLVEAEVTDGIPLTFAQQQLCTRQPHPRYVTQAVLWRVEDDLDAEVLAQALPAVLDPHDSFRLRLDGSRLRLAADAGFTLERLDLSGGTERERAEAVLRETTRLQRSLDPVGGPTVRGALLDLGPAGRRLFLTAHHLAVDSASWRILRGELAAACRRPAREQPGQQATTPYGVWAQRIGATRPVPGPPTAGGGLPWAPWGRLDNGGEPFSRATTARVRTPADLTATLLELARRDLGTGMDSVVLAAVTTAVAQVYGTDLVACDIERHGRDQAGAGTDISRTTGWFTDLRTVRLAPGGPAERLVKSADHALHDPDGGVATRTVPAALVNYLGRFTERPQEMFAEAEETFADDRHPDNHLTHPVEVHAAVNGAHLVTVLTCDGAAPDGQRAQELADAYAAALESIAAGPREEA
ncbi:condensation domain-containing protein [Streptantibioticus silvisoli]|uniref:Condensation domain-containing protein n=1 Tax=Streptantibioticus silvisoli TaxID=2705255 RepID=A0ABT6W3Y2_9ACTN|nr:condensation domain-containing protein [Streptantibioticus silvisoli]MDI5965435.1 condensation domain-containing protein [Streptantibioticus silvisoli]